MANYSLGRKRRNFIGGLSATNQLIFANIILFFPFYFLLNTNPNLVALTPNLILSGKNLWTFITSMFAHGGVFHIFANMFSLFFIGNFLERIIGRKRLLGIYFTSGLIGGIFFVLSGLILSNNIPGVGASGAIFGLLGVLAVLVPFSKIYLIAGPLILIILEIIIQGFLPQNLISYLTLVFNILIFIMIFAMFSFNPNTRRLAVPIELPMWLLPIIAIVPLMIIGFFIELPIGNSAHLGGLIAGLFYGFYLRRKFPKKTNMLRRHFR